MLDIMRHLRNHLRRTIRSFGWDIVRYRPLWSSLLEAGINLITVECAFGAEPFELGPSPSVIQVRGRDVMGMKERLLNLAIERLPPHVTKVAWVDADFSAPQRTGRVGMGERQRGTAP